jgi:RluA family pseudouridine synthase
MSQVKNFQFKVNEAVAGISVKQAVFIFLYEVRKFPVSKRDVKSMIDAGKVHMNGRPVRKASVITELGQSILVQLPRIYMKAKDEEVNVAWELTESSIIFEDDAIIAVNKPSGLSTQASLDPKRDHLYLAVRRYLEKSAKKDVYVGLHHRLDVDTSGIVVFTKKKSANKALGNQFEFRKIQKTYLAVCYADREITKKKWEVKNHLGRKKSDQEKKLLRMESVKSGGDPAHTFFRILEQEELMQHNFSELISAAISSSELLAIEAKPKTGRTHQIRVHLAEDSLPIVGDRFYFEERQNPIDERLQLHAWKLRLLHPITKEELHLEAPFTSERIPFK